MPQVSQAATICCSARKLAEVPAWWGLLCQRIDACLVYLFKPGGSIGEKRGGVRTRVGRGTAGGRGVAGDIGLQGLALILGRIAVAILWADTDRSFSYRRRGISFYPLEQWSILSPQYTHCYSCLC